MVGMAYRGPPGKALSVLFAAERYINALFITFKEVFLSLIYSPHLVDHRAIHVEVKQRIGDSNVVNLRGFLVHKVQVRHPEPLDELRVQFQVGGIYQVMELQAIVVPGLGHE